MRLNRAAEWGVFEVVPGEGIVSLDQSEVPRFVRRMVDAHHPVDEDLRIVAKKPVLYLYGDTGASAHVRVDAPRGRLLYHWPPYKGGTALLYQNKEVDWVRVEDGKLVNPRTGHVLVQPGQVE